MKSHNFNVDDKVNPSMNSSLFPYDEFTPRLHRNSVGTVVAVNKDYVQVAWPEKHWHSYEELMPALNA